MEVEIAQCCAGRVRSLTRIGSRSNPDAGWVIRGLQPGAKTPKCRSFVLLRTPATTNLVFSGGSKLESSEPEPTTQAIEAASPFGAAVSRAFQLGAGPGGATSIRGPVLAREAPSSIRTKYRLEVVRGIEDFVTLLPVTDLEVHHVAS